MQRHARVAKSLLCGTSARFLVTGDITSDDKLPSPVSHLPPSLPDWLVSEGASSPEHALRRQLADIEEENQRLRNGIVVIRRKYRNLRLNRKLYHKEHKAKSSKKRLFKGRHGLLVTSDEVLEGQREIQAQDESKGTKAKQRKESRMTTKAAKEKKRQENAALRKKYEQEMADYRVALAAAKAAYMGRRKWSDKTMGPPKPIYPFARKKQAGQPQVEAEESAAEVEQTESDSDRSSSSSGSSSSQDSDYESDSE
ncbi:hypothetical protein AURDEDRAFT_170498 [Auricularia subglabra TFB-10046 SS5]|nr:hypothetical protein AURDEDRAFT_170498 [Auricularia subglabra TFB-10046 SS5]